MSQIVVMDDKFQRKLNLTVIHEDNPERVSLYKGGGRLITSEHVVLRYYHFKERVEEGQINFVYVVTYDQLAGVMTKALPSLSFKKLLNPVVKSLSFSQSEDYY